jgi:hypothetical protein
MPNSEAAIWRRIEEIKAELVKLGPLRPGHLSQQYNVCGTPGCRCKADPPRKHGPYYQLSYTWRGKSRTEFVRPENLPAIRQQLSNYERLRDLLNEWITLGINAAQLQRQGAAAMSKPKRKTRISPKPSP